MSCNRHLQWAHPPTGPVWVENATRTAGLRVPDHPSHCSGIAPSPAFKVCAAVQTSKHSGPIPKFPVHFVSFENVLACPLASASLKIFRGIAKSSGGEMTTRLVMFCVWRASSRCSLVPPVCQTPSQRAWRVKPVNRKAVKSIGNAFRKPAGCRRGHVVETRSREAPGKGSVTLPSHERSCRRCSSGFAPKCKAPPRRWP